MTDPIADMLTRIRNAQHIKMAIVEVPFSSVKQRIADILKQEGYIGNVETTEGSRKMLVLELNYVGLQARIQSLKRESKPGHRRYFKADENPRVLNDYGIAIVSTSQGLMTNKKARTLGLGGEVICSVY